MVCEGPRKKPTLRHASLSFVPKRGVLVFFGCVFSVFVCLKESSLLLVNRKPARGSSFQVLPEKRGSLLFFRLLAEKIPSWRFPFFFHPLRNVIFVL